MIAGITGHRNLGDGEIKTWIKYSIRDIVFFYKVNYGYTCLAPGADEAFATVLRENQINYTAVIPSHNYEMTFKEDLLDKYIFSLNHARKVITLNFQEPSELAFYEAGKLVVDKSSLLIAIWNGEKAKGLGGTADIVEYSIKSNKNVIHINNVTKLISKIN